MLSLSLSLSLFLFLVLNVSRDGPTPSALRYPSKDADGAIVRPLPRAKRYLADANCLPHLVQLLLTFDPIIVEKVNAQSPLGSCLQLTGLDLTF